MTDTARNVLLAGASGVFGRHVATTLTRAGFTVTGLGRGPENEVRADLLDRAALLRAVDGVEAGTVVHAATALRRPPMRHGDLDVTDRLRVDGTRNLLEAARVVGARRVIAETMVFGYGYRDFGGRILTEDDPYGPAQGDAASRRHTDAMRIKEELVLGTPGIEGIALRFGLFYGPGGTDTVVDMLRRRMLPAVDDGERVLPWVHLADAAHAVVLAVEGGRAGSAYNIADHGPQGFGTHVRAVARAFGTPRPLTVPAWLTRPMPYAHRMFTSNIRVSCARAEKELGWSPRYATTAEGLAELAAGARGSRR